MNGNMDQHYNIVAYLNFAYGALIVAIAILMGSIFSIISSIPSADMPPDAAQIMQSIGGILTFIFVVLSVPYFLTGYGILKRYEWSRILGIVVSVLALLSFPIGTAIGAYSIWALTRPEAVEDFF